MTHLSGPATPQAIAAARRSAQRIDRALLRFVKHRQTAVRRLASQHPRLADLSLSFPALLFALAVPRQGFDPAPVIADVIAGAKLKRLAAVAGLPLWTRRLVPEAFNGTIPNLPSGPAFTSEICNFLPRPRHAARWLACVTIAADVADERVALWMARHVEAARLPFTDEAVRRVALWAWYAQRPDALAGRLAETPWTPQVGLPAARDAAWTWRERVSLTAHLGLAPIEDVWFDSGEVDGYLFEPLCSAEEIAAEAKAMRNCSSEWRYGSAYRRNRTRLWRVTKNGARVAMVETRLCSRLSETGYPLIDQFAGPGNGGLEHAVKLAIYRWWLQQPIHSQPAQTVPSRPDDVADRAAWIALWGPYWRAKRRLPAWLPLSTTEGVLLNL